MGDVPPLALNHVNLPARDPQALRQWYVENLGFVRSGDYLRSGALVIP